LSANGKLQERLPLRRGGIPCREGGGTPSFERGGENHGGDFILLGRRWKSNTEERRP